MVNKPRLLGTAAETAVVQWLKEHGHPHAERRAHHGTLDQGDVTGVPGLCIEVKVAGRRGLLLGPWLKETEIERANANADFGILVAKPRGLGPKRTGRWLTAMYFGDWRLLCHQAGQSEGPTLVEVSGTKVNQLPSMLKDSIDPYYLVRAVGKEKEPGLWYAVTDLEEMNWYLLKAGYGTPIEQGGDGQ